jgi:hypothetical protein
MGVSPGQGEWNLQQKPSTEDFLTHCCAPLPGTTAGCPQPSQVPSAHCHQTFSLPTSACWTSKLLLCCCCIPGYWLPSCRWPRCLMPDGAVVQAVGRLPHSLNLSVRPLVTLALSLTTSWFCLPPRFYGRMSQDSMCHGVPCFQTSRVSQCQTIVPLSR